MKLIIAISKDGNLHIGNYDLKGAVVFETSMAKAIFLKVFRSNYSNF